MAAPGARVHIYGDWDGSGVKKATKDLTAFEKHTKGFADSFTKSFAGIGATLGGALALGTITRQMQQMARAAADDQKSVVALGKALDNLGMSGERSGVEDFISSTMMATGVADDELRPAMARLLRSTEDVSEAQKALGIALDLSAATGKSLDVVANGLGKAYDGNAASLGRLGLGLDRATLKSADMDKITAQLSEKFGGQASAAAATYAGQMDRINLAVGEAQESIGYALLGSIESVVGSLGGTDGLIGTITETGETIANFTAGVGNAIEQMASFGKSADDTGTSLIDMGMTFARQMPGLGLFITTTGELIRIGEDERRALQALNDELAKSKAIRDMYSIEARDNAAADDEAASAADRRAEKAKKLREALNGPARNMIAANLRIRELRAQGPQDTDGTKGLSRNERESFGLSYASAVEDKYQLLVDAGRLKKAQRLLANSREYLGGQIGGAFAGRVLGTPQVLSDEISRRDSVRGSQDWRQTMSAVFGEGSQVTINVNADTPAQVVQQAKNWARLAAAGRGAGPVAPIGPTVNPIVMPGANIR